MEHSTFRSQLVCLPLVLRDKTLVEDIVSAWHSLSRACHHHPYELAPIASELETWISQVERLIDALDSPVALR
jgi:anaerobic glycerol-3-phosphate dehydrogenase